MSIEEVVAGKVSEEELLCIKIIEDDDFCSLRAKAYHKMYEALCDAGFDVDNAVQIVAHQGLL